jgi:hypothetical protein
MPLLTPLNFGGGGINEESVKGNIGTAVAGRLPRPSIAYPLEGVAFLRVDDTWLAKNRDLWGNRPTKLTFQFIDLEAGVNESAQANYADIDILGRAESYKTYIGAGNRELQLTLNFRVQGTISGIGREVINKRVVPDAIVGGEINLAGAIQREVVAPALWLEGLKQPLVGPDELSHAPPPCFLQLGDLFASRVIVTGADVTWQAPFTARMLPHGADVSCTFTVVRTDIQNFSYGKSR